MRRADADPNKWTHTAYSTCTLNLSRVRGRRKVGCDEEGRIKRRKRKKGKNKVGSAQLASDGILCCGCQRPESTKKI